MPTGSAKHQHSPWVKQESGDQQCDQQNGKDAKEELQELFEQDAVTVEFFAFKEEFHGSETHATITEPTEDVNQDWQEHQRSARQEEGRVEEVLREKAHGEASAGVERTVGLGSAN